MGGRGTFAAGRKVAQTYQAVGSIEGVKILHPLAPLHGKLPEESHSSNAYILLDKEGNFRMFRWYDKRHRLRMELAYHREPALAPNASRILHIHRYRPGDFRGRTPRLLTAREYNRFKRFFKEELRWKP